MTFGNPTMLLGLGLLPLVALLLAYAYYKRITTARRFADPEMARRLMPAITFGRPLVKGALTIFGLAALIIALARPQWGAYRELVSRRGVDLFVLLDVSRSMLAKDVKPDRLTRAKSDIKDLLPKLEGDRVGLIVFAGQPVLEVPLTTDQAFFRNMLDEVDSTSAPIGGSLIGDAIRKALNAMEQRADRDQAIVLITDGEDQESFPEEAAKQAAERGVKIFAIGLGDPVEGGRIPIKEGSGFVKQDGQEVWSKMDEKLLQSLAMTTKGAYIPAKTRTYDLGQVYEQHLANLTRGVLGEERKERYHDRFQWFLAAGLMFLLLESLIPQHRAKKQVRNAAGTAPVKVRSSRRKQVLATSVATGLLLMSPLLTQAAPREAVLKVREGINHYKSGNFKEADNSFAAAEEAAPEDPRVLFDRGCALAAQKELDKSIELFEKASVSSDPGLAADSMYNLGDVYAQKAKNLLGEKPDEAKEEVRTEAMDFIGHAVDHYRNCLRTNPNHEHARHNLELLRVWSKQIQSIWKERDKAEEREKLDPLAFLERIQEKQKVQRSAAKQLGKEADSPLWRSKLRKADAEERELADEIEPLKQKIVTAITQPPSGSQGAQGPTGPGPAPQPPLSPEQQEQALAMISEWTGAAEKSMIAAAADLGNRKTSQSIVSETAALEDLNRLYVAMAPFEHMLQKAMKSEKGLIERSAFVKETPAAQVDTDFEDLTEEQTRIAQWAQVMGLKAKETLKSLAASAPASEIPAPAENVTDTLPSTSEPDASKDADPNGGDADAKDPSQSSEGATVAKGEKGESPDAEKQDPQAQMKIAMQTAVDLTPKIQALANDAAADVKKGDVGAALPKQEEAQKLLKEIADKLPKQKNDQQQKQDQQQDQDQKSQDQQQNQDQKSSDQGSDGEQKQDQKSQEKDSKDQSAKDKKSEKDEAKEKDAKSKEQDKQNDDKQKSDKQKDDKDEDSDKEKNDEKADKAKEEKAKQEKDAKEKQQQEEKAKQDQAESKDQKKDGKEDGTAVKPGDLTDEKAEGMFRRTRQRQLEHRQRLKALEKMIYGPVKVEKDW